MLAHTCLRRVEWQCLRPRACLHSNSIVRNASSNRRSDESLFSQDSSAWDKVFENIEEDPPAIQTSALRRQQASPSREPRKQAMTAREINAFDQMFNMIFDAVSKTSSRDSKRLASDFSALLPTSAGIGRAQSPGMSDVFGKLRRQSKNLRWSNKADEELDKKREAMELCESDQQLLEWAMREVFEESTRCEEKVSEDLSSSNKPIQIQPRWYPHMISLLIRTFRDKYGDPHLALSVFDYARHLSVASFVFGCTSPVYNELIETRWRCFRDLRGVCDALEEMRVNGVEMDNRTRSLVEVIRRETGQRNMWQEESTIGSGEVWDMISRMERLVIRTPRARKAEQRKSKNWAPLKKRQWSSANEVWKGSALEGEDSSDGWEFDAWEHPRAAEPRSSDVASYVVS